MKQVSGKELARLAEKKGWELKRVKGSHHVYVQEGRDERVVIPMHGNRPLKIGLLKAIMKIIPLKEEEL